MHWSNDLKDKDCRLAGRTYHLIRARRRTYANIAEEIVDILRGLPDETVLGLPEGLVFTVASKLSDEESTVIIRRLTQSSISVTPAYLIGIKSVDTPIICGNGVMARTGGAGAWGDAEKRVRIALLRSKNGTYAHSVRAARPPKLDLAFPTT